MSLKMVTLVSLLLLFCSPSLHAVPQDMPAPTAEEVEAAIEALGEVEGTTGGEALAAYQKALDALQSARVSRQEREQLRLEAEKIPALLVTLNEELDAALETEPPETSGLDLGQLEERLSQAEAERGTAHQLVDELKAEEQRRTSRLGALPEAIAQNKRALGEHEEALSALPEGSDNEPRRVQLRAELEALRESVLTAEAEQEAYLDGRELLSLRQKRAQRQLSRAEDLLLFWQDKAAEKRQAEADTAARQAERQREETLRIPGLAAIAARNEELASLRSGVEGLPKRMKEAEEELARMRKQSEEIDDRFHGTRQRIAVGGLTESLGVTLRRDLDWLPSPNELQEQSRSRSMQLSEAQLHLIDLEEESAAKGPVTTEHAGLFASLGIDEPTPHMSELALELLQIHSELYDALVKDLGTFIGRLYDQEVAHREIASRAEAYGDYIESRIFWVRSSGPNPLPSLVAIPGDLAAVVSSTSWGNLVDDMAHALREAPVRYALLALLLISILLGRRYLRKKRQQVTELVRSYRTDHFMHTVRALVQTGLLALPLPLLLWSLGDLLRSSSVDFGYQAGRALRTVSLALFVLECLRQMARPKGVGEVHFRWPGASMMLVRRELTWFAPVVVLGGSLATIFFPHQSPWTDSLGRLGYLIYLAGLALLMFRLTRKGSALFSASFRSSKGLLARTERLWAPIVIVLPLGMIGLLATGYSYTAHELEYLFRLSLGLATGLLLVNALLLRWLFIARRRLAVEQAHQKMKARAEAAEQAADGQESDASATFDEDAIDIPAVDAQTRQIFRSAITIATILGLFFIWSTTLPELRGLDHVQLWPTFAVVSVAEETPRQAVVAPASVSSSTAPAVALPSQVVGSSSQQVEPAKATSRKIITLKDALLATLLALITVIASKNIPGLLELTILKSLPLDSGARYAISTLVRYVILILGVSATAGAIGLSWSSIQWLAAALTFGLAFGLQEIFANFVSGVIILLERPIRVGDIVSVGGVEGRVTKLRMRATTVQDWDRRELLIPNKEFITTSVTNWTLTDPITRIVIPVGIAYGSDTKRARALLLKCARENPAVVDDPQPSAIFRGFGDSSLDFELRVFLAKRDLWPELMDSIHGQIDDAFREAEIEIAFPQRDLHIRSAKELDSLRSPEPPASG